MPKLTKTQLKQMVIEFLAMRPMITRYQHLETQIKASMDILGVEQVETDAGRVEISLAERMNIKPSVAREVLGLDLAEKVIQRRETVSMKLLRAFVEAGEITGSQFDDLAEFGESKKVVSLRIKRSILP